MNSLMSMRTICSSLSKRNSARALLNSVLPTPVGPKKRKEPLGRRGSERPARERRMALLTAATASSCPTTRACRRSSILSSFSFSPSSILATGMPVQREMTSAISSSRTSVRNKVGALRSALLSCCSARCNCASRAGNCPYWISAMRLRSPARRAFSSSSKRRSRSFWSCEVPSMASFSPFQISSSSWYLRFSSVICCSRVSRRFLLASSFSFASATFSMLS